MSKFSCGRKEQLMSLINLRWEGVTPVIEGLNDRNFSALCRVVHELKDGSCCCVFPFSSVVHGRCCSAATHKLIGEVFVFFLVSGWRRRSD
ncbi:hypothetical protein CSUI_002544 [Cystoisospora suis]|uniref:Uncharacterized protein n=1 Tax=Cystoisospora suis TaxID=483139 RepID=A0A2C6L8D4_9APIC|nr:hypothetical protein CSUI_002544 [Cystoisospora suis]